MLHKSVLPFAAPIYIIRHTLTETIGVSQLSSTKGASPTLPDSIPHNKYGADVKWWDQSGFPDVAVD